MCKGETLEKQVKKETRDVYTQGQLLPKNTQVELKKKKKGIDHPTLRKKGTGNI